MKFAIGLKSWITVLPFISFWMLAFCMYYLGLYQYDGISIYGLFYILFSLFGFIFFYNLAIQSKVKNHNRNEYSFKFIRQIINITGICSVLGVSLFVVDKLRLGVELFFILQNELYNARDFLDGKLTYLTTIGVFFYSFKSIFFASVIFHVKEYGKLRKHNYLLFIYLVLFDIINMYFSANRGILYSYFAYIVFYFVVAKDYRIMSFLKVKKSSIYLVSFSILSASYFFYVANTRTIDTTLEYQANNSKHPIRFDFINDNLTLQQRGSLEQLYSYFTHGLEYTDAIVINSSNIINLDVVSPLGIRVQSQIKKIYPNFRSSSAVQIENILNQSNKSLSGWPSVFGFSAIFFGVIGGIYFFWGIGFICGFVQKKYLITSSYHWLIMSFAIYECMLLSFDWFIRDFNLIFCLLFFIYLKIKK